MHYGLSKARVVFTIHNLEFGAQFIGKAIEFSDKVTTVSTSNFLRLFNLPVLFTLVFLISRFVPFWPFWCSSITTWFSRSWTLLRTEKLDWHASFYPEIARGHLLLLFFSLVLFHLVFLLVVLLCLLEKREFKLFHLIVSVIASSKKSFLCNCMPAQLAVLDMSTY